MVVEELNCIWGIGEYKKVIREVYRLINCIGCIFEFGMKRRVMFFSIGYRIRLFRLE